MGMLTSSGLLLAASVLTTTCFCCTFISPGCRRNRCCCGFLALLLVPWVVYSAAYAPTAYTQDDIQRLELAYVTGGSSTMTKTFLVIATILAIFGCCSNQCVACRCCIVFPIMALCSLGISQLQHHTADPHTEQLVTTARAPNSIEELQHIVYPEEYPLPLRPHQQHGPFSFVLKAVIVILAGVIILLCVTMLVNRPNCCSCMLLLSLLLLLALMVQFQLANIHVPLVADEEGVQGPLGQEEKEESKEIEQGKWASSMHIWKGEKREVEAEFEFSDSPIDIQRVDDEAGLQQESKHGERHDTNDTGMNTHDIGIPIWITHLPLLKKTLTSLFAHTYLIYRFLKQPNRYEWH